MEQRPDKPTDAAVIAEFRRRRFRQRIAGAIAVVALIAAMLGDKALGHEGKGALDHPLALAGFAVVLAVVVYSLKNWRCPKCAAYLGKRHSPRYCSSCGARLAE